MKKLHLCASAASILLLSACKDKETAPVDLVEGRFDIVNEQGQVMTNFAKGQNVFFRFEIKNTTSDAIFLENPIFDTQHFLELYQVTNAVSSVSLGKPYTYIFCTYQGGYPLAAKSTLTLSIPWVEMANYPTSQVFCGHATNNYLQTGHYKSSFTAAFTIVHPTGPKTILSSQPYSQEFDVR